MPAVSKFQVGFKDESVYGTPVTVDRFGEFISDSIQPMSGRVISKGMRSGQRIRRKDRQVTYREGAAGTVAFEVLSNGFGFWLKHMLGTVGTTGPTDSKYIHTGTVGDLKGKSFTYQSNHPFHPADTDQAITFEGGKIAKWKLGGKVAEILVAEFDMDFEDWLTATALATASYPSAAEPLSFIGGVLTAGGSGVDISDFELTHDAKLFGLSGTNERRYIRGNALHKEPVEGDFRDIGWSFGCDWEDLTQFNRVHAALASGVVATIALTFTGQSTIGVSAAPTMVITIDEASFDAVDNSIPGPAPLLQKLTGAALFDGSTSPVTIAYGTSDSTP